MNAYNNSCTQKIGHDDAGHCMAGGICFMRTQHTTCICPYSKFMI